MKRNASHRVVWRGALVAACGLGLLLPIVCAEDPEDPVEMEIRVVGPDGRPVSKGAVSFFFLDAEGSCQEVGLSLAAEAIQIELVNEADGSGVEVIDDRVRVTRPSEDLWIELFDLEEGRYGGGFHGPFPLTSGPVEIAVAPARTAEGVVRGANGRGVAGVRVTAWAAPPLVERPPVEETGFVPSRAVMRGGEEREHALTDSTGAFRIQGLGVGRYVLVFATSTDHAPAPPLEVEGGQTGIDIRLRKGAKPTLRIVDWQKKPVTAVSVELHPEPPSDRTLDPFGRVQEIWEQHLRSLVFRSDAKGAVKTQGLDPKGTYRLVVLCPEREDCLVRVEEEWRPRSGKLALERAFTVTGTVLGPDLSPAPEATVWVGVPKERETSWFDDGRLCVRRGGSEMRIGIPTKEDGSFVVKGLREDDVVELRATPKGLSGGHDTEQLINVPAGARGVTLMMERAPGPTLRFRIRGWKPEDARGVEAQLLWRSEDGMRGSTSFPDVQPDGTIEAEDVEADLLYTLWIHGLAGGRYVLVPKVGPQEEEIVANVETGKAIAGRIIAPEGVTLKRRSVLAIEFRVGINAHGRVAADGSFTIEGLPDGHWTVMADGSDGSTTYGGQATVPAGGTVDVQVDPR